MITAYDVKRAFEKAEKEGTKTELKLDVKQENVVSAETGEVICAIDEYVKFLREKYHCNFETIYYEHVSCTNVIRCKDCGTVIFTGDDERWEPNLKCPTCSGQSCMADYWTKEDIENDVSKQAEIEAIEKMQKDMNEMYARQKARGGLRDSQIWKGKKHFKNRHFDMELECRNWIEKDLRHLHFSIRQFNRNDNDGFILKRTINIPLNPSAFYLYFIYPMFVRPSRERKEKLHKKETAKAE